MQKKERRKKKKTPSLTEGSLWRMFRGDCLKGPESNTETLLNRLNNSSCSIQDDLFMIKGLLREGETELSRQCVVDNGIDPSLFWGRGERSLLLKGL